MATTKQKHNILHYLLVIVITLVKGIIYSFVWLFIAIAGLYIVETKKSPYDILIGLPLLLISGGFIINALVSGLLSVFSSTYNRGICPICGK